VAFRRYTVVIANRTSGVLHRFSFSLLPTLLIAGFVLSLPILIGLGARWSVRAELGALKTSVATLEMENASYRAFSGELTAQVAALEGVVDNIGTRSTMDADSARAVGNLRGLLKARGVGGGDRDSAAVRSLLSSSLTLPEDNTFAALRDFFGRIQTRLQIVRADVENRAQIAASTPSIWPTIGNLSAFFGQRDDPFGGGGLEYHTGLDISTDKGHPVVATAAGRVESASNNGNYGNLLVINHGFGLATRYAHLASFAVRPGDLVERGQLIGYVGTTGRTTGPHLHYELLVNGALTNPLRLLTDSHRR
jgi:murein DD-endopeptidase MepM/ murein hydrolase activator NlpD